IAGGFGPRGLTEGVDDEDDDGRGKTPDKQEMNVFLIERRVLPIDEKEEGDVSAYSDRNADGRDAPAHIRGGGDHRKKQNKIVNGGDAADDADEQITDDELEKNGGGASRAAVQPGNAAFHKLEDR